MLKTKKTASGRSIPYQDFARIYDRLMGRRYVGQWWDWFRPLAKARGWTFSSVADIAGGTGEVAACFRGWKVALTIVDRSPAMLARAKQKLPAARIVQQDMRRLKLASPVDLVLCIYGGLHYLPSLADLQTVFRRVHAGLRPGGWFCFDFFPAAFLKHYYGGGMEIFQEDDCISIWRCQWNAAQRRSDILVESIEKTGDRWRQHRPELHPHQAFPLAGVKAALRNAGFRAIEVHLPSRRGKRTIAIGPRVFLAQAREGLTKNKSIL